MSRRLLAVVLLGVLGVIAVPAAAQNAAADHPGQYDPADVAAGAVLYGRLCINCHGVSGTGVGGIDLHRGVLPRAGTDEALRRVIATGFPQAGMPAFHLEPQEIKALVAYVRAGGDTAASSSVALGDAPRGREVFRAKGNCLSCHRVGDQGGFAAPDLTDIGRARTPAMLQRSLLEPTKFMRPINRPVRAVLSDGRTISGRRLNEDSYTVQLMTDEGHLVSLVKSELKQWHVSATSTMPSYKDLLTPGELADLVAYLVTLKG